MPGDEPARRGDEPARRGDGPPPPRPGPALLRSIGAVMMVPIAAVRRLAVAAQRFAQPRPLLSVLRQLSCVQLDSISAVDRSHRIVLSSRAGPYARDAEWDLLRRGKAFEYWAHEASLVPMEDFPLFRYRMRERRVHHWFGPVIDSDP